MTAKKSSRSVLKKISLGFSVILVIIWLAELLLLPHYLLDEPAVFYWPRVLVRTIVVGAIWFWMHRTIAPLLTRMRELEDLLRICSWCRKVGHQDHWLTMEEFFGSALATQTSHSICPVCAAKARSQLPSLPSEDNK